MRVEKITYYKSKVYVQFDEIRVELNQEVFKKNILLVGNEYSEDEIKVIQDVNEKFQIRRTIKNLIQRREHSKKEIIDKLKTKKYSIKNINEEVEEFLKLGLIDDNRFAKMFTENRINFKKKSPKSIAYELMIKGINKEQISENLKNINEEIIRENALNIGIKKLYTLEKFTKNDKLMKIRNHLLYKGFSIEVVNFVLTKLKGK